MSLNEKIKYCRKPIFDVFDDIPSKEEKKVRPCISGISDKCRKTLKSTKDHRICDCCADIVKMRNEKV